MAHILQRSLMQLFAPLIWAPSFIRWTEYDSSRFYCRCSCAQCFHENTDGDKGHQSGLLNQQLEAKQQGRASSLPGWCILSPVHSQRRRWIFLRALHGDDLFLLACAFMEGGCRYRRCSTLPLPGHAQIPFPDPFRGKSIFSFWLKSRWSMFVSELFNIPEQYRT